MAFDDPLIGKQLGDYTIQGLLGRGGMSRVYRGYDENLDRYAAVKVISGDFVTTSEEEYTRRFQTEARAIARLRHENIVGVYQFGRTEGIYYMAQVFLEGKDLRTLLKEYAERHERIPREEGLRIVRDITSALDYAHEQGVIHRDIKPSNIMLEKSTGRAILMDFGLALSVHEGTMGDTFGSAHYIAPEQAISSAKAVPQSDLYSLGIVIYEMLAGKVPFDDPSVMSVALKHLNELPPPPTMYNPDLSPSVEAVVMRVLDKDPNRRHATGRQLHMALQDAFDRDQVSDSPEQISITDMLASRPSPPGDVKAAVSPDFIEFKETPRPTGIAGRFAQRHEERKAEVAIEADSDALGIDDATLNSILEGYDDPGKIGLTGKNAAPLRPSTAPQAADAPPRKKRRSRVGLLLFVLLLLVIGFGAAWFGLGLGDSDDGDTTTGDATGESTTVAAAADLTATAEQALTLTATSATPTDARTATNTAAPTATHTARVTDTAQPEPTTTQAAPLTPNATDTVAPSETSPAEPSATAATTTAATTATATATENATAAAVAQDSTPSGTPSATATGDAAASEHEPNLRLVYSEEANRQGQLLLVNLTTQTLDVSSLVFERERRDGVMLRYEARLWNRLGISAAPSAMPGRSCFQLVTTNGTARTFGGRECPSFLGFYRTNIPDRYFWLADEPGATFSVYDTGSDTPGEPLAICAIEAGRCDFYMGPDAETVVVMPPTATFTLTPAAETPTATATQPTGRGAELRLLYNSDSFLLINNSSRRIDVSALVFEQRMADGATRRFDAAQWDRSGIIAPPSRMEARGCYQLVTVEGVQDSPEDSDCMRFLGWFRTGVTSRYFWLSSAEDAEFIVRQQGSQDVIATCAIDAGECIFTLSE